MAQKFIGIDDAATQLGISKDELNALRENGQLRAYRDGASWKFRSDEIDKLAEEGVRLASSSDLGGPGDAGEIELADDSIQLSQPEADDGLSGGQAEPPASDLSLDLDEPDEPTVPAEPAEPGELDDSAVLLASDDDDSLQADDSDESILLSESELGDLPDRPPSTIIGKADLGPESDLDLTLEPESGNNASPTESDVKLAPSAAADVLSSGIDVDAVLSEDGGQFDDIEELEIDLEAESSRILSPEDAAAAQAAAGAQAAMDSGSELSLAASDSAPGLATPSDLMSDDLGSGDSSGEADLTGISQLELGADAGGSDAGLTGLSSLELEEDEEEDVLGEGSDITLSSGDSGINIVAPSDSGLALDEVPLDLSGSAMGSSLDLGEVAEDITLEPMESLTEGGDAEGGEDFLLTPITEGDAEDQDSSSQVIALDEVAESEEADALLGSEEGVMGDEFAAAGLAAAGVAPVAATTEASFTTWNVVGLSFCTLMLAISGMMMVDLLRNIWSWNKPYSLNSSLIDGLLSLF